LLTAPLGKEATFCFIFLLSTLTNTHTHTYIYIYMTISHATIDNTFISHSYTPHVSTSSYTPQVHRNKSQIHKVSQIQRNKFRT
jgi:hypothetical protein